MTTPEPHAGSEVSSPIARPPLTHGQAEARTPARSVPN